MTGRYGGDVADDRRSDDRGDESGGTVGRAARWCFESRETGEIVVGQTPNAPLWVGFGATAVRLVAPEASAVETAATVVATAAFAWWAVDEVVRGVNPFRRALGGAVLLGVGAGVAGGLGS